MQLEQDDQFSFRKSIRLRPQIAELGVLFCLYAIIYIILRIKFPFPNITADTNEYIYRAQTLVQGPYRPLGYSIFLQMVHRINPSCNLVFTIQYWFNAVASCLFLFTIKQHFAPARRFIWGIYTLFVIINPMALYLTTFLISDSLFNSLTLLWLVTGIWLIYRRSISVLLIHLVLIVLAVNLRYIGMFYPALTVLILISTWGKRCIIPVLIVMLLGTGLYVQAKHTMEKRYGFRMFSALGGWAQANNAVSILPHVKIPDDVFDDPELLAMHQLFSACDASYYMTQNIIDTAFIWQQDFPGKKLTASLMKEHQMSYEDAWVYAGAKLNAYARILKYNYPLAYIRYFVFVNAKQIFYPQKSMINRWDIYRSPLAVEWYGLSEQRVPPVKQDLSLPTKKKIASMGHLIFWACVLSVCLFGVFNWKYFHYSYGQWCVVGYMVFFVCSFLALSLWAHPLNARYLMIIYIAQVTIPYLVVQICYLPRA